MNATIIRLTFRQLLGQKRTMLMLFFALIPIGIAILFRFAGDDEDPRQWTAQTLLGGLTVGTFLPLAALVFGTAALGTEFEDGTAPYLLSKPIPRHQVVLSKLFVAWVATASVVLVVGLVAGIIGIWGEQESGIVVGYVVAIVIGALVYNAGFIWLSIATSRALIVGLVYVFLWENIIASLFAGVRFLSIRQFTLGIAGGIMDVPERIFDPRLGFAAAVILSAVAILATIWLAIRGLRRWEIGEAG